MQDLSARGVGLRVLAGQGAQIDTTTAASRLVFGIFAAMAEFERELIRERTVAPAPAATPGPAISRGEPSRPRPTARCLRSSRSGYTVPCVKTRPERSHAWQVRRRHQRAANSGSMAPQPCVQRPAVARP